MKRLLDTNVTKIIMIVGPSRGGSSLFKTMMAKHTRAMFLDGEEEPYYALSGNGYGLSSASDAFDVLSAPELLMRLIETELHEDDPIRRWRWRLGLQFPGRQFDLDDLDPADPWPWLRSHGIAGHYDGCERDERLPFDLPTKLEEPPFVLPSVVAQPYLGTLVLKTPQNSYRIGALEKALPWVEFKYIHLTRSFAASVNGLMDGWNCDFGFFAHRVSCVRSYADELADGWWKYDMPPGWTGYVDRPLHEICMFQWLSANQYCLERLPSRDSILVRFEDFLRDPNETVRRVCDFAGLEMTSQVGELPRVMVTGPPREHRWKKRADLIRSLAPAAIDTMLRLGYSMDEETWT